MNHGENNNHWSVEIARLRYIKHLKVVLTKLQELFPLLSDSREEEENGRCSVDARTRR
ncbi:hypothetical protein JHK85_050545 [Glycine max]|nr:hypothetical protein JHK85_050545 [Glycine max]